VYRVKDTCLSLHKALSHEQNAWCENETPMKEREKNRKRKIKKHSEDCHDCVEPLSSRTSLAWEMDCGGAIAGVIL